VIEMSTTTTTTTTTVSKPIVRPPKDEARVAQARQNIDERAVTAELAAMDVNAPYIRACPWCGAAYPAADAVGTNYTCINGVCQAVFSITTVKMPRDPAAEEAATRAAAAKAKSDAIAAKAKATPAVVAPAK
jgi:hypothetical protein